MVVVVLYTQYGSCGIYVINTAIHPIFLAVPLQLIAPKVDLPLRDDKCDFWDHFKTAISFRDLETHQNLTSINLGEPRQYS